MPATAQENGPLRKSCPRSPQLAGMPQETGPRRNDSVGRKGMASRILSQSEARARRGPMEGPDRANNEALAEEDAARTTDPIASFRPPPERFSWEERDGVADSFARRGESEARADGRPVTSEQRSSCGRRRSQHDRSHRIVPAKKKGDGLLHPPFLRTKLFFSA